MKKYMFSYKLWLPSVPPSRCAVVSICVTAPVCCCLHLCYCPGVLLSPFVLLSRCAVVSACAAVPVCCCLYLCYCPGGPGGPQRLTRAAAHRYLIEQGADVAAVNNDGELPVDLCEEALDVRDLLRHEIAVRGERRATRPSALVPQPG